MNNQQAFKYSVSLEKKAIVFICIFALLISQANSALPLAITLLIGAASGYAFSEFIDNLRGISGTQLKAAINSMDEDFNKHKKEVELKFSYHEQRIKDLEQIENDRRQMYIYALQKISNIYSQLGERIVDRTKKLDFYLRHGDTASLQAHI